MYFTFQGTYQDTGHMYNYYDCTGAYEQLGNSATTDKGRGEGGGMFGGSEREGQFMNVVKEDRQRVGVTEEDAKAEEMKADDLL